MDRTRALRLMDRGRGQDDPAAGFLLPSRVSALEALGDGLELWAGPVLLTGNSGVGKSWLVRGLQASLPAEWQWVNLDLTPSLDAPGLYRAILRELAVPASCPGDADACRAEIDDALTESDADGLRWGLVADEAHVASDGVLEALRVLGNRLGSPGTFAGIVLVGQTRLARRLECRPLSDLGQRVAARVHLRPLDVGELGEALVRLDPAWAGDTRGVERLHRDTGGNPRLAFRYARRVCSPLPAPALPPRERPVPAAPAAVAPPVRREADDRPSLDLTAAVPSRPPLEVSDDVVEVDWDAMPGALLDHEVETDDELSNSGADLAPPGAAASRADDGVRDGDVTVDGLVHDRYAALQAWAEWSRSRSLASDDPGAGLEQSPEGEVRADGEPVASETAGDEPEGDPDDLGETPSELDGEDDLLAPRSGVRVEGQHGFAPYSQLFSRLRLPRDVP